MCMSKRGANRADSSLCNNPSSAASLRPKIKHFPERRETNALPHTYRGSRQVGSHAIILLSVRFTAYPRRA
jgi:hypothetical protein